MNDTTTPAGAASDRPFKTLVMTLLEKTTRTSQSGMQITNLVGEETPGKKARAVLFAEHARRFDEALAAFAQETGMDAIESKARVTLTGFWKKRSFTGRDQQERTVWEFHVRDFKIGG